VKYELPLNEVVFDFYDRLKSVSKGYASFDYHLTDYKPADLVKMQILVNNEPVDALSMLVHRQRAEGLVGLSQGEERVVVTADRTRAVAFRPYDYERQTPGGIVRKHEARIRGQARRGNVAQAADHNGAQVIQLLLAGRLEGHASVSQQLCPAHGCCLPQTAWACPTPA